MDLPYSQYYKLNRMFLLPLGLWPHGSRKIKPIQAILFYGLLLSSAITQLTKIFTTETNLDSILIILSFAIPFLICIVMFSNFYIQAERLRRLMEQIDEDWSSLKSDEEILIIRNYTLVARRNTATFALLLYSLIACYILYYYTPHFLDFVAPLNESRSQRHMFLAEYFVDQKRYFDSILAHMIIAAIVAASTFLGTETMSMAYMHHACGMLKIASCRLKHVLDENTMRVSLAERNVCIRGGIVAAIEVHRKAIHTLDRSFIMSSFHIRRFVDYFSGTIRLSNFIILGLGVASLSINLFRAAMLPVSVEDVILLTAFVCSHFYYVFLYSYAGQKVMDHSADVFTEIYNVPWYEVSVPSQKLLLFMMQRSIQSCKILLGGIFSVSLEGVTTITSMSLSYFTVLCSTR